jgi:hypothetical protein
MNNKSIINTRLPLFSSDQLLKLVANKIVYKQNAPRINKIKAAFVTYDGLVVKNFMLKPSSAFNLIGFKDKNYYYVFWREAIEKYLVCKFGKSIPSVVLSNNTSYLLIHSKWFNYSFWVNAYLPRLVQFLETSSLENVKLIVPHTWSKIPYVQQSLALFSINHEVIPEDHQMFITNLTYVELRDYTSSFYPASILTTSEYLKDKLSIPNVIPYRNIYLTRRNRGVRSVENETELIAILEQYNFEILEFENLSFIDQVSLMSTTKVFISIHGAGFSNMMFMQPNSYVVELINREYALKEYTFPFWRLANASSLYYSGVLCNVVEGGSDKLLSYGKNKKHNDIDYLVNQNIVVPLIELTQLLNRIINDFSLDINN